METLKLVGDDFVEKYRGIVLSIAKRYFAYRESIEANGGHTTEDLIQYGMLGLVKAKASYDPTKGTSFSTYLYPKVKWEIQSAVTENTLVKMPRAIALKNPATYVSINLKLKDEPDQETEIQDTLHNHFNLERTVINNMILRQFLSTLNELEKLLWFKVYDEKIEQSVLADQLGLSRVKVNRILSGIKKKAKVFGESIYATN
ncbi:sigma-70 family RNA polymerase sigma factor [Heyndrickxia sp. FSL W8-0423]|uniref:sigma-70 family RNA polymerase sigma factor n=1 Tax=Heyndrickxia sp. FSL W8-0423 TaxID=2921601 RepID=UPI0030FA0A03